MPGAIAVRAACMSTKASETLVAPAAGEDRLAPASRLRLLTFSTLYPNAGQSSHGIFVETRLRHLLASGGAEATVIAPIPWFPSKHPAFGRYAVMARVPRVEERFGLSVLHPRYPLIPHFGMSSAPFLLAQGARPAFRSVLARGYDFDVIDAHYFYPDGVAATLLGAWLSKPVVITARGTDINLIPQYRVPRALIRWAARRARHVVAVCQALKDAMVDLGIPESRITVLRNGVDLERFRPIDRVQARTELNVSGATLLSVGHLVERKGHHVAIEALVHLPEVRLIVAGDGEAREALRALAQSLSVSDRVRFVGAVDQSALATYYNAADALVLASSREGWANVLLEAMACGTPAIATRVWGTPEVVAAPEAGVLMRERTPAALAEAYRRLCAARPDRLATRRYAERFSWDETTRGQLELFREVCA